MEERVRVSDGLANEADACAESGTAAAVDLFRSLADPARLTILRHLTLGEHRVVDLTAHLGLAQSTTSAHLLCLRDCGLVSARTVGRASMYSLAVPAELLGLLAAAERLLAVTGDAVTLCPTNHDPRADTDKADTDKADTDKADTDKADTDKADTDKADTVAESAHDASAGAR